MLASAIQALVLAGISSAFTPQQIDRVLSDIQQSAARGGVRVGRKSVGVGMGAGAGGIAKVRRGGKVLEFNEASPGNNIDPTNQMTFFRYKQYDLSTPHRLDFNIRLQATSCTKEFRGNRWSLPHDGRGSFQAIVRVHASVPAPQSADHRRELEVDVLEATQINDH